MVDSSDDTLTEIACQESVLWQQGALIYLRSTQGAGHQRNVGVAHADYLGTMYVALLDDDIRPDPNFFSNCIDLHQKSGTSSVVGGWDVGCSPSPHSKVREIFGFSGPEVGFFITKSGQAIYGDGAAAEIQHVEWLPGGMMFARTEALLGCPYRDEFLIYGGDLDLCLRLRFNGFKLLTSNNLGVKHLSAVSGKEPRWRYYLGYFRVRYWFSRQPYAKVESKWVIASAIFSIFYNLLTGILRDRRRLSWAMGEVAGVLEWALGRSRPTKK